MHDVEGKARYTRSAASLALAAMMFLQGCSNLSRPESSPALAGLQSALGEELRMSGLPKQTEAALWQFLLEERSVVEVISLAVKADNDPSGALKLFVNTTKPVLVAELAKLWDIPRVRQQALERILSSLSADRITNLLRKTDGDLASLRLRLFWALHPSLIGQISSMDDVRLVLCLLAPDLHAWLPGLAAWVLVSLPLLAAARALTLAVYRGIGCCKSKLGSREMQRLSGDCTNLQAAEVAKLEEQGGQDPASRHSRWIPEPEHEPAAKERLDRLEAGDLVMLGAGVPAEFRNRQAVVRQSFDSHCTVIVLDDSLRFGTGECWPNFCDMQITSTGWRIGSRVRIAGLQSDRLKHLNGSTGSICAHKREGHPSFIVKSKGHVQPQLLLCIRLDDPAAAKEKLVLLEPRYLISA